MNFRAPCSTALGFSLMLGAVSLSADESAAGLKARLVPPAGAPVPAAGGQVSIGSESLTLMAEGLEPGEYSVLLDDGAGNQVLIGILSMAFPEGVAPGIPGEGDGAEDPTRGLLLLDASNLPFEGASSIDLSGRIIRIDGMDGTAVLAGRTPMPIDGGMDVRAGRCPIGRPDPAPDPDAEGVLKIESGAGRLAIKVHVRKLEPDTVYRVSLIDPAGGAEGVGLVTTDENGIGQFKLDSGSGDPIPFGAGDLPSLVGFGVEVREPGGAVVLAGAVCEPEVVVIGDDDDSKKKKECQNELAPPEPAPVPDAEGEVVIGEVEGEGSELEVEITIIIPAAAYDVVLTEPVEGGASETIGRVIIGCNGRADVEIKDFESPEIPFGKGSVAELAGYRVAVKGEDGAVVLEGTVPDLACPQPAPGAGAGNDDDEDAVIINDCSAGEVPANLIDGPLFQMIGDFDAPFLRGDANGDHGVDISDPVRILVFMFQRGPRPRCLDAADINDDGLVDISDVVEGLYFLFLDGRRPRMPGTLISGFDPTPDRLRCAE